MEKEPISQITQARNEFIEEVYPKLFGGEEMGDPSRNFTPSEITAVLQGYESLLAARGLLVASTDLDPRP